jgi:hypothetical protein
MVADILAGMLLATGIFAGMPLAGILAGMAGGLIYIIWLGLDAAAAA